MSDIECLHKIIFSLGSVNRSGKILYFPKNVTFFNLDGCLQPCSLVNVPNASIRIIKTPLRVLNQLGNILITMTIA